MKPPRAVRAMNETLKQNRLLREQGDDGSFSPSNDRVSDLQKNVCFLSLGNRGPVKCLFILQIYCFMSRQLYR